ncbi:MAG: hypothetical protein ACR2MT_12935 [Aurantibacter sp.]
MGFLKIFSGFEAVFSKHSELLWQKRTKKYGKRAKNPLLGLVLTGPCLILLFVACGSYPKKQNFEEVVSERVEINNPYFSDSSEDYVYKADIKVFKNSFSGIFIVKKMGDAHHRIAITTEMGNKLFDFEFEAKKFKINQILPEMDKKVLINVLKRDFLALIEQKPFSTNSYVKGDFEIGETLLFSKKHYYLFDNGLLKKIVRAGNGKEKVTFLFSEINDNIANDIQIKHQNIRLEIYLKRLKS